MKPMEYHDIIDQNDHKYKVASRKEVYQNMLSHRIVHILVFNKNNEMLIQLRSKNLIFCPLHWCSAAGGHVQAGETYHQAALRELKEEIGITTKLKYIDKTPCQSSTGIPRFLTIYEAKSDGPFHIDQDDLEEIKFSALSQIQEMINSGAKFHPDFLFILKNYYFNK